MDVQNAPVNQPMNLVEFIKLARVFPFLFFLCSFLGFMGRWVAGRGNTIPAQPNS